MKTKKESMWVKRNGFKRLIEVKKGTFDKTVGNRYCQGTIVENIIVFVKRFKVVSGVSLEPPTSLLLFFSFGSLCLYFGMMLLSRYALNEFSMVNTKSLKLMVLETPRL